MASTMRLVTPAGRFAAAAARARSRIASQYPAAARRALSTAASADGGGASEWARADPEYGMGAYTSAAASTFNGMPLPASVVLPE